MKTNLSHRLKIVSYFDKKFSYFRSNVIIMIFLKFLLLGTALVSPLLYKMLINDVMLNHNLNLLVFVCLGYLCVYLFETVVLYINRIIENNLIKRIKYKVQTKLWCLFTKADDSFHIKYNSGEFKNRIDTDIKVVDRIIIHQTGNYVYNLFLAIVTGIIIVLLNFKLALILFFSIPLSVWVTKIVGKGLNKASKEYRDRWGQYEDWLGNVITSWKEIRNLRAEKKSNILFVQHWKHLSRLRFVMSLYSYGFYFFIAFKDLFITKMNIYFVGALLIIKGEITIATLLMFIKYFESFLTSMNAVGQLDIEIYNDKILFKRISELYDFELEDDKKLDVDLSELSNISFSNVSYKYDKNSYYSLKNINMEIRLNEKVAIVGKSGSGKSTLIKVLLGICQGVEGTVLFDGIDINTIRSESIYKNIGVIMQDSTVFNLTVRENLFLANPDATDEELKDVCRRAYIHQVIERMPKGYETEIGENGVKLSGGEKQRLAIARVLLLNPKIIIFDEATSALDHESEQFINMTISEIAKEKTIIIITHRFSSTKLVDRIVIIEDGMIVGDGSPTELSKNNSGFSELFRLRSEGGLDDEAS